MGLFCFYNFFATQELIFLFMDVCTESSLGSWTWCFPLEQRKIYLQLSKIKCLLLGHVQACLLPIIQELGSLS